MEYFNIDNRKKSFISWPLQKPKAKTLAKNGSYYLGEGDRCKCSYCGVVIEGWEKWHDVSQRHDRLTPICLNLTDLYDKQGRSYCTPEKGFKYLIKHVVSFEFPFLSFSLIKILLSSIFRK